MPLPLIIFDCDGTVVDSEVFYNTITSELLVGLGLEDYTPERCIALFGGQSWGTIKADLKAQYGDTIPDDIIARYLKIAEERMDQGLKTPDHVTDVLDMLRQKNARFCVASNGERGNVIKSLKVTGLLPYFDESLIFTKTMVPRPKPAPDLFLFVAETMGTSPDACLVIEDSVAGVTAAHAANMRVLGFTGTAHDPKKQAEMLKKAGADYIIEEFIHILNHI